MTQQLAHFVAGRRTTPTPGRSTDVFNPATGDVSARLALASKSEVADVVQQARQAQVQWANVTPLQRARVMFRFKELVEKNIDELAALVTAEHGKTIADAKGSITRGLEVVEFACGIPHLLRGDYTEQVGRGIDSWSVRQPLGVCAGIAPFNFPAMVPLWMFPLAIACGNAFILKPSERDPSCPLRLAELATEAGLPPGILNVVNGDKEAVDALLTNPHVDAISFVGSTTVAEYIYATGSAHGKRVQALGGAKNHMVIMPDADLDQAADALMGSGYGSAGERCMAISVAVAVGNVGDKIIEKLEPMVSGLKVGPGTDSTVEMGPLVTKAHYEKVRSYIDAGVKEGAKLVVDGRNIRIQGYENGYFLGGSLFDNVMPEMKIYREEIFGPVLSIVRAPDFNAALKLVNDHEFGNGAAIFTRDGDSAREFSRQAKIGMIGINVPIPVPAAFHSFGGWKRSLFGDSHMHGMEGVRFFTRLKTTTSRWPTGLRSGAEFVMPTLK